MQDKKSLTKKTINEINHFTKVTGEVLLKKSDKITILLRNKLWLQVLIALILGIFVGIILGPDFTFINQELSKSITNWIALPGHLFLQLVKMIIIPLIFSSIILGILSSGSPEFLKKIGPRIGIYFIFTTTIAIIIGLGVTEIIQPGNYINIDQINFDKNKEFNIIEDARSTPEKIVDFLPSNPLQSMVAGDLLGVIIFSIIFGIALLLINKTKRKEATNLLSTLQEISMMVVKWAMYLVPLAVFGLITQVTSQIGISALKGLTMYIITVLLGLLILLIFYYLIVFLFAKKNPFIFMSKIKNAQLLAFSTSSSAATMPLSLKTAQEDLKVKPAIAQFVIPIGATINMDGTALYQAAATVFLAQAFGVPLTAASLGIIIAITVGSSIGAPSIPGVGIVILATILESVGIPGAGIGLILGVDRIIDMCRTSINVTGDLTACVFFERNLSSLFSKNK